MMRRIKLLMGMLLLFGCFQEKTSDDGSASRESSLSPLSSHYIVVESIDRKKYCIVYSDLTYITPFDNMDYQIGQERRDSIVSGEVKLGKDDFEKVKYNSDEILFEVSSKSDNNIDSLANINLDSSGVLKLDNIPFNLRGNVIEHLIQEGYSVYFSDYQGVYLCSKNKI